ncbi:class I SAM-dependent methyltransferase [Pseudorhodoplanes sp.]|uniref:class I SAM-dependent methyltransferase n=1 Tax=Pseudorhodoplanes sp. TaxID=1934341 RepID=UPI003D13F5FB
MQAAFSAINESKANFDHVYVEKDPRQYFNYLGQLDYIIPHLAQPIFKQIIRARAATQSDPVTVLDLGSSYGVNGALMKYALSYDALRDRYTAPALQGLAHDDMLELDRAFYLAWPRDRNLRVIGLDISENAVRYGQACGAMDMAFCADLEADEPKPEVAAAISEADIITSTGCVGYVGSKTFDRVMKLARKGRTAWVVSFVLRMFPYDRIAATLSDFGLETEKFQSATFVQRRFANREEMEAVVKAVEMRGIDTRGFETEGVYHADLYVSRPRSEIERAPLQEIVNVVSGANKPWTIGTNVMSQHGDGAHQRARGTRHLRVAPGS